MCDEQGGKKLLKIANVLHLALILGLQGISPPNNPVSRTAPEEISSGRVKDKTGDRLRVTCELLVNGLLPSNP